MPEDAQLPLPALYDLTVMERSSKRRVDFRPAGSQPFGSYNIGDIYSFGHSHYRIASIQHALLTIPGYVVRQTLLVVDAAKTEDHPIPWPW